MKKFGFSIFMLIKSLTGELETYNAFTKFAFKTSAMLVKFKILQDSILGNFYWPFLRESSY